MATIDLNCDTGESFGSWRMGDDAAMFTAVSSANIACGFHAGDPSTIAATCLAAATAGVVIGAHVGYRDLAGFGRRFMDCSATELADDMLYQIGALDALARTAGSRVSYVKPHGALYNTIVHHQVQAQAVIDGIRAFSRELPVLLLPGSVALDKAAAAGLRPVAEAFADRAYTPAGTLVPRSEPGAVLTDEQLVIRRMRQLATCGTIQAIDGSTLALEAESICVHSDTPGAVAMAHAVRDGLEADGISVRSFTA